MNLHSNDFYSWTQQQSSLLKQRCLSELDIENLIEEIEDMGRSEARALESRLAVLVAHLLKWQYQIDYRSNSWRFTIETRRKNVKKLLRKNPGLKPFSNEALIDSYDDARLLAIKETNLAPSVFPNECPWSLIQVLDDEFWPNNLC